MTKRQRQQLMAHARAVKAAKRAAARLQTPPFQLPLERGDVRFLYELLDGAGDERAVTLRRRLVDLALG